MDCNPAENARDILFFVKFLKQFKSQCFRMCFVGGMWCEIIHHFVENYIDCIMGTIFPWACVR